MARRKGAISKRDRNKSSSLVWIVLLTIIIGVILVSAFFVFGIINSRPKYDAVTLCPEEGPSGVIAVLLDLTDPLNSTQAEKLNAIIENIIDKSETHTLISVGIVSESPDNMGAKFARCKPASGDDANVLYENPSLINSKFENNFIAPLTSTINDMMKAEVQSSSPIMESLQALLAETPFVLAKETQLTIVVASDLLQHSNTLSFYRGEGWDFFKNSSGFSRLSRNLGGAKMHFIKVPRPEAGAKALAKIDPFWSRYFDQQGATAPFTVQTLGDL